MTYPSSLSGKDPPAEYTTWTATKQNREKKGGKQKGRGWHSGYHRGLAVGDLIPQIGTRLGPAWNDVRPLSFRSQCTCGQPPGLHAHPSQTWWLCGQSCSPFRVARWRDRMRMSAPRLRPPPVHPSLPSRGQQHRSRAEPEGRVNITQMV